jgi:hypothetical protein
MLVIPYGLAVGLDEYLTLIQSSYRRPFGGGTTLANSWWDSLIRDIADVGNSWTTWLWLDAALLAALLLFVRASGYRLMKK